MPTTITSAGVTFNDTTSLTSANIGTAQLVNGSVTAAKLGTNEQTQISKAWVNFAGTTSPGTIRTSYNVSSITKNGIGDYTVNFATPMANDNYSAFGTARMNGTEGTSADSRILQTRTFLTGSLQVYCTNGPSNNGSDSNVICVHVFGN